MESYGLVTHPPLLPTPHPSLEFGADILIVAGDQAIVHVVARLVGASVFSQTILEQVISDSTKFDEYNVRLKSLHDVLTVKQNDYVVQFECYISPLPFISQITNVYFPFRKLSMAVRPNVVVLLDCCGNAETLCEYIKMQQPSLQTKYGCIEWYYPACESGLKFKSFRDILMFIAGSFFVVVVVVAVVVVVFHIQLATGFSEIVCFSFLLGFS